MLFGVPVDPILCLAVIGGTMLALCGAHAWTEGHRFERLYGGRDRTQGPRRGPGDRAVLIFRRAPQSAAPQSASADR
ncbi:MAG: hypothetical protein OEU46_09935 [Alphaproteobacteria bacterium]|nr:hypothetical protein [Alphaproteobacteria bacterium]